jgi:hypothetical protein
MPRFPSSLYPHNPQAIPLLMHFLENLLNCQIPLRKVAAVFQVHYILRLTLDQTRLQAKRNRSDILGHVLTLNAVSQSIRSLQGAYYEL